MGNKISKLTFSVITPAYNTAKYIGGCIESVINTGYDFEPSDMSYSDLLDYWIQNHCYINLKYHTVNLFMHIMIPIILILNIPIH